MKKVLILLVVCFMAIGAKLAMADVRTDSLGLQAGQQVNDLDSIWLFPQDAASFGNVVDNRMGNAIATGGTVANDWVGVITQEWSDVGYIGIYTKRPFEMSNGVVPSNNPVNQFGILNGFGTWNGQLNPATALSGAKIGTAIADAGGHITATFTNMALVGAIANPENKLDAFWAKVDGDTAIGVHINYASQDAGNISNTETYVAPIGAGVYTKTQNEAYSGVLGADLGLGLKNTGFDNLNLAVGYSLGTVNYNSQYTRENNAANATVLNTNQAEKDNGISEIRANILGISKVSDASDGRLFLGFRMDNLEIDSTSNTVDLNGVNNVAGYVGKQTNAYTDMNVNLGYAINHKVGDGKALVVVGLTAIYDDRKWTDTSLSNAAGSTSLTLLGANSGETEEETSLVVPFNVALEAPVFSWMKVRLGATKNLYQSITDKVVQPTNINAAGTAFQTNNTAQETQDVTAGISTFLGAGMVFDNFSFDVQVSPNALLNYARGFAPGQGILYGTNANGAQTGSSESQLLGCLTQMDMRYAF